MEWITDKSINILTEIIAWVIAMAAFAILISLAMDSVEDYLDRLKQAAGTGQQPPALPTIIIPAVPESLMRGTTAKPTRPWRVRRGQRGAVIVSFALILPVFLLLVFGGITLNLAAQDKGRLAWATEAGAKAGSCVLLTKDESGNIVQHETEARTEALNLFNANAPAGTSLPTIAINGHVVSVSASKPVDFMGFLPAIELSATSSARASAN